MHFDDYWQVDQDAMRAPGPSPAEASEEGLAVSGDFFFYDFLDGAWPEGREGKQTLLFDFGAQLGTSDYWAGIKQLNGW